jgi:2-dehydro-3-deoxyphosphooctonate aldolase (KDO 8-P synthase)
LAQAAVATGVAAVFLDTHPHPDDAPCDGPNMIDFEALPALLTRLKALDALAKSSF